MKKWSTPEEKLSHNDKPLRKHINEIKDLLKHFLEFYGFSKEYFKFADFLAEYHDYGKLHIDWKLGSKKGHSHFSYQYLIENKIVFDGKLDPLLQFLILKHHSMLTEKISENLGKRKIEINGKVFELAHVYNLLTKEKLNKIIDSLQKDKLINFVDVFGLFKLADVCSAKNKIDFKFTQPEINKEKIVKLFLTLDEKRWKQQIKLIDLPNLSILRAYTGWGKTTAGLLFFANKQVKRIFYLMPTITSINKLFQNLKTLFGENNVSKYFYFLDTELKENEEKLSHLYLIKNFTTPFVITTVDQFLLSFLQVGKYYTKRVMFRNSGLLVDEVHLLNPLMLYLLVKFIKIFSKIYNLKVLFMSATLSTSLVRFLKEELGITKNAFLDFLDGYKEKRRVLWRFFEKNISENDVIEEMIKIKNKGKRVLVIVNTVNEAIKVGKKLESDYKLKYGKDFIILHSRFMYLHRKEKEEWIEKLKNKPHILISTQVCEVSLDISYEYLFTELASLPSLIQRFGRVNRYGEKTNEVNVFIFKPEIKKRYPYSKEEIEKAKKIIKELEETLKNEKEILEKMDEVLTYEDLIKEINTAKKEVDLQSWEKITKFFFSLNLKEEKATKFLEYREGATVLVIPHPDCIFDKIKERVRELINKSFEGLSFEKAEKLFAEIKEIAIPVPIWLVRDYEPEENKAFPIINFKNKIYNKKYGFHDIEEEENIL